MRFQLEQLAEATVSDFNRSSLSVFKTLDIPQTGLQQILQSACPPLAGPMPRRAFRDGRSARHELTRLSLLLRRSQL